MSTISAGLVNATNLTVTGTQAGAVTATNFNTAVVNTGDVNATRCIISNGPSRDGVLPGFTSAQIAAIQSYANDIADGPKIPNSFVAFGNANEETIYTVVSGKQSNGGAVPSNPYFRLASCSKLIGGIATAKLMADRWINTDTPIASYLGNYDASSNPNGDKIYDTSGNLLVAPWKSANRKIIDASGNVTTMQAAWTAWGATQNPPVTGACPDITVGHCLNHTVGLSYDYYTFGRYTGFLELCHDNTTLQRVAQYGVSDTPTTYAKGQTGTSVQNGPIDPPHHLFDASGNPTYTSDNYLTLMSTQPLSSLPGVLCEYSRGMDVMGFMFDQLIKQNLTKFQTFYNNTNIVDVITFIQQIILIPAGINDSWVYGGQSQPPADCKTNMLSSSTARNVTSAAGAKCIPYGIVDTSQNGLVSVTGVPVAKYSYTDASNFTFTGYFDASNNPLTVWSDAIPNDTNSEHMNNLVYANKNPNLKHVGQLASAWQMSIKSFAKLLRLYANDGFDIVSDTRIMPKSAVRFIKQASVTNGQIAGIRDQTTMMSGVPLEYNFHSGLPILWSYGGFKIMDPGTMPNNAYYLPAFGQLPFNVQGLYPMSEGSHYWAGLYNATWYVDSNSGAFAIFGTNQPGWAGLNSNLWNVKLSNIAVSTASDNSPINQLYAPMRLVSILDGAQQ